MFSKFSAEIQSVWFNSNQNYEKTKFFEFGAGLCAEIFPEKKFEHCETAN